MKVFNKGRNYFLVCKRENSELTTLYLGGVLEASEIKRERKSPLQKRVTLAVGNVSNPNGFDIKYSPENGDFKSCREVRVTISRLILGCVQQHGRVSTFYDEHKKGRLEILDGMQGLY